MPTPRFSLPLMATNTIEKEALFNELSLILDTLVQTKVISLTETDPTTLTPSNGDVYIVGIGATDIWTGEDENIAFYYNGWQFIPASPGMRIFDEETGNYYRRTAADNWVAEAVSAVSVLSDLTDVSGGVPADGEGLRWNDGAGQWEPGQPNVSLTLLELTDIDDTDIADGRVLVYDIGSGNHIYVDFPVDSLALDDLTDVDTTGKVSGQFLKWNGATWEADDVVPPAQDLGDLGDVDTTGAAMNDYLVFNGASWVPSASSPAFSFLGASDTPSDYGGQAGKLVAVNGTEDGLEFIDAGGVGGGGGSGYVLGSDPGSTGGARVQRNSAQLISTGVETTISWQNEVFDDLDFVDIGSQPTRITIPSGVTRVRLTAGFENAAAVANVQIKIVENGTTIVAAADAASFYNGPDLTVDTGLIDCDPGDYYEVIVYHDAAGTIDHNLRSTFFTVENKTPATVPVLFAGYAPLLTDAGTTLAPYLAVVNVNFPADLPLSRARVLTAPDADTVYDLKLNDTPVGTLTFLNGQTTGTFSTDVGGGAADIDMVPGDLLTLETRTPTNTTIEGLIFSIIGTRV